MMMLSGIVLHAMQVALLCVVASLMLVVAAVAATCVFCWVLPMVKDFFVDDEVFLSSSRESIATAIVIWLFALFLGLARISSYAPWIIAVTPLGRYFQANATGLAATFLAVVVGVVFSTIGLLLILALSSLSLQSCKPSGTPKTGRLDFCSKPW
jgi:hypothetical protein